MDTMMVMETGGTGQESIRRQHKTTTHTGAALKMDTEEDEYQTNSTEMGVEL
uniref:Uncharacterized protein n=1 Tax=viral metagenome TaxID=1070528 RepID=A0A6M3KYS8_9ZZZZ